MIWQDYAIPLDQPASVDIGPLHLRFAASGGDLRTALRRGSGDDESLAWKRWAVRGDPAKLTVRPATPTAPVVVKPAGQLHMLTGSEARIWCQIPIWVRLELAGELLTEMPARRLSETWFGRHVEGELCYWVESHLTRERPAPQPHLFDCPLKVINRAQTPLPLERMCLRAQHLTLFADSSRVTSDEVIIRYDGAEQGSRVEYSGRPPEEASQAPRAFAPRQPAPGNAATRTFHNLREWMRLR